MRLYVKMRKNIYKRTRRIRRLHHVNTSIKRSLSFYVFIHSLIDMCLVKKKEKEKNTRRYTSEFIRERNCFYFIFNKLELYN